jgi:hypothetical protein
MSNRIQAYPEPTEMLMKRFYNTLGEKDQRRYAAIEAQKLGYGGVSYVAELLGCSRTIVHEGLTELEALTDESAHEGRQRQAGGGRKGYQETKAGIDEAFLQVVENHTAGDPMEAGVKWTNLSHRDIQQQLNEQHQMSVSETVIRKLLHKHGFRRRKAQKNAA